MFAIVVKYDEFIKLQSLTWRKNMKIRGITHTGITVKKLEKSLPFYRDFLGLEQISQQSDPVYDPNEGAAVGVPDAIIRTVLLKAATGQLIELLEYTQPFSGVDKPMSQNTLGAHHVSFTVDDIEAWRDKLKDNSVEYNEEPKVIGPGIMEGIKWLYFKDPDGIVLEFMELPKGFKNF